MNEKNKSIEIRYQPYRLKFRYPFRIAHGVRTHTDIVLVSATCNGLKGFGEATLPPYLPETIESVSQFLDLKEVHEIQLPLYPDQIFDALDLKYPGNMPAKAALDMALWQLKAQLENKSIDQVLGIPAPNKIPHTYTIGIGSRDEMRIKIEFAMSNGFTFFKLKLNGADDEAVVNDYLSLSNLPFAVDANQSWNNLNNAIAFAQQLTKEKCMLIEQPFDKWDRDMSRALLQTMTIPLVADEAFQRITDLASLQGSFNGINIKLQKCGGITEARHIMLQAKEMNYKLLIGCMSESSIGCSAAEALASLCDWADLDGPWLIENNFETVDFVNKV